MGHVIVIEFDDGSECAWTGLTNDQVDSICDTLRDMDNVKISLRV